MSKTIEVDEDRLLDAIKEEFLCFRDHVGDREASLAAEAVVHRLIDRSEIAYKVDVTEKADR